MEVIIVSEEKRTIAISSNDARDWGCPHCGFDACPTGIAANNQMITACPECHADFMVMGSGETVSRFQVGDGASRYRPQLVPHPRAGTAKHGLRDTSPPDGSEFFRSRGIGLEGRLVCFVCGSQHDGYLNNISGFVTSKPGGERVVKLFSAHPGSARLDYRHFEPHYIQVKIGACDTHRSNLEKLHELCADGTINQTRIQEAIGIG